MSDPIYQDYYIAGAGGANATAVQEDPKIVAVDFRRLGDAPGDQIWVHPMYTAQVCNAANVNSASAIDIQSSQCQMVRTNYPYKLTNTQTYNAVRLFPNMENGTGNTPVALTRDQWYKDCCNKVSGSSTNQNTCGPFWGNNMGCKQVICTKNPQDPYCNAQQAPIEHSPTFQERLHNLSCMIL